MLRAASALVVVVMVALAGCTGARDASGPSCGGNSPSATRTVAAWAEARNDAEPRAFAAQFTEDATLEDLALRVAYRGKEGALAWASATHEHIRDAHVEVLEVFQRCDHVSVRWMLSGSATTGKPGEEAAAGPSFSVPVTTVLELRDGKIASESDFYDAAELDSQLGRSPTTRPGHPPAR